MIKFRPNNWWQAGLMWGTVMFAWYVLKDAARGQLTLWSVGRNFVIWEAAGVLFGILLTGALSLLSRKNLFRGFPEQQGDR